MSEVDVSVVMATCGRENLVRHAVESALKQVGVSVEVIVVDDSANGSAKPAIDEIRDERVRYLKRTSPSNGKPALARNDGAQLARGRFIHFLDDDDLLEPDALWGLSRALAANGKAGLAFGETVPFGDNQVVLAHEHAHFQRAAVMSRRARGRLLLTTRLLFQGSLMVNSACLTLRELFLSSGGYDPQVPVCEDVDLWVRIARRTGFVYLNRPVLRYRTGHPSLMHNLSKDDPKLRVAYERIHDKYRRAHGSVEFFAMKLLARTFLR